MDKYRNPGQGFAQNQHHAHPIRRNYANVSGPRISPRAVRTTTCATATPSVVQQKPPIRAVVFMALNGSVHGTGMWPRANWADPAIVL